MQNKCDAFSVLLKLTPTQQGEVLQMTILKQLDNFCSEKSENQFTRQTMGYSRIQKDIKTKRIGNIKKGKTQKYKDLANTFIVKYKAQAAKFLIKTSWD